MIDEQDDPDPSNPHEYVGGGVDIGVGVQMEPCHLCGREEYEAVHK